jgi:hypothetical protein
MLTTSALLKAHRWVVVFDRQLPILCRSFSTKVAESPSLFRRFYDKYSVKGQQKRIDIGERLFRAASIRAKDP